jgi:signal peptidase I
MTWAEWQIFIQQCTESFLTKRKQKKLIKRNKHKQRHPLIEWTLIIIEVVFIVIIINLFLFQNYRIPSESMVPELQIGDLIFVEKLTFGPEILPGRLKLPAFHSPQRGEVVSFESRNYALEGPWVEFWQRFIYMITLTMVNLKVDENNRPIKDLLIKRVIGLPGERIRITNAGEIEFLPRCEITWLKESTFQKQIGHCYTEEELQTENSFDDKSGLFDLSSDFTDYDPYFARYKNAEQEYKRAQYDIDAQSNWFKQYLGWYIPENRFFPMGDNRSRSMDAREYGPVPLKKIQGKALFRWLPFDRIGAIK